MKADFDSSLAVKIQSLSVEIQMVNGGKNLIIAMVDCMHTFQKKAIDFHEEVTFNNQT